MTVRRMKIADLLSQLSAIAASLMLPVASGDDLRAGRKLAERLASLAPQGVELHQVSVEDGAARLQGTCYEAACVSRLLHRVEAARVLLSPILRSLRHEHGGGLSFEIVATIPRSNP
jgi:hypothetical protein